MKIYICGYGVIHFTGKCNCWKKSERTNQHHIELRGDLNRAKPGTYYVTSYWEDGKQIIERKDTNKS